MQLLGSCILLYNMPRVTEAYIPGGACYLTLEDIVAVPRGSI